MIFLKAFFSGRFFPGEYIDMMKKWNRIFYPLEYGMGISRFKLPRIYNPLGNTPELIGHSGLLGTFAFHCPEKDAFLTGTVNQTARPGTSFRLMLALLGEV